MAITKPFKKGYRYEIQPTEEQKVFLAKTFGCCRYVYNRALSEAKLEYENWLAQKEQGVSNPPKPSSTGFDFVKKLPIYKNKPETTWLKDVSSIAIQQSMLHLGNAYSAFFRKRKGYPRFKTRHGRQCFSLMDYGFNLSDDGLRIAKLESPIKVLWSRGLPSAPSSLSISMSTTGRYHVSFICETTGHQTYGTNFTGVDLGLTSLVVISDGTKVNNPRHTKKYAKQLRRAQQSLVRKQKGSKNSEHQRVKVAEVHERIANSRNDHLHKLSRRLINENQVIGLEALVVKNMVRNRKLSKHISDASWGTFKEFLIYKARESQQCSIVLMDAYYPSSHVCSGCNKRLDRKLKLSERIWTCPYCSKTHDRDINAALNIRNEAFKAHQEAGFPTSFSLILANNRL